MDFVIWGEMIYKEPDKIWNSMNPPGFAYGENLSRKPLGNMTAGAMMRGQEAYISKDGFFNNYAATSQEEDKAETWAHMVRVPGYGLENQYIYKKINYLKRLMGSRFPALNSQFWERVEKLRETQKELMQNII